MSFTSKPELSESVLMDLLCRFGVKDVVELSSLPSERDQNVRVTTKGGDKFVFKVSREDPREHLEAQNSCLNLLRPLDCCPRPLSDSEGRSVADGPEVLLRLLTYESGKPLALFPTSRNDPEFLSGLAALVGRVDVALQEYDHPALHRDKFQWDLQCYKDVIERFLPCIHDDEFRSLVDRVYRVADAVVAPVLPLLPRSTIHGDLNTWNILVNEDRNNSGAKLIDFGDMIWSITIADPAILMAYCLLDASVGLSVICSSICSGYSSSRPLSSTEREVLFPLAALRLCTSAVITASQTVAQPNNQHLLVYQSQVRAALPNVFSHLVCSTTRFRAGEAKDESFYVAGVREVLDLEGTFTWSDKEADEQRRVWRETLLRGGALVADNTAGKPVAFVTWTCGSREAFSPPHGAEWLRPFVWIDVSYVAPSHRRGGLARLLYDAVRAEARQNKELVETQLDVYAQNVNSLAFHASIGFRNFATVLRRPVSLAREAASGFSFRVAGEEDRVLLDKAVAWRSDGDDKRARQMREMWNKNSWVARNEHGIAVACFHWSVCGDHPFGVSYGKYEYEYLFVDMIYSEQRGAGAAILKWLDLEAAKCNLQYILTGVMTSCGEVLKWLHKQGFRPYVCIFSKIDDL